MTLKTIRDDEENTPVMSALYRVKFTASPSNSSACSTPLSPSMINLSLQSGTSTPYRRTSNVQFHDDKRRITLPNIFRPHLLSSSLTVYSTYINRCGVLFSLSPPPFNLPQGDDPVDTNWAYNHVVTPVTPLEKLQLKYDQDVKEPEIEDTEVSNNQSITPTSIRTETNVSVSGVENINASKKSQTAIFVTRTTIAIFL